MRSKKKPGLGLLKTMEDWSQVIFPDESNFKLFRSPGFLMFRQRPKDAYKTNIF